MRTNNGAVTEEELMVAGSERSEQTSKGSDQTAQHCRETGRFPSANGDSQRWEEESDTGCHGA